MKDKELLQECLDTLLKLPCNSWICTGPDKIIAMKTCGRCRMIYKLNKYLNPTPTKTIKRAARHELKQ